ncbi:hypothetical protein A2230_08150 [candidate division WOR-1 bacterium RIFOXYA2_FULL_36_21]|uniref:Radical SAM core domain-containing protein n=1 Tax=candidate division WOR-1 bacterium RIFOXYB2_FULL_36_35 TaxID=1802578 RepID=A0A1F4S858_UNCSA|nr:MAG: hypothetical protein A2230_08150 [candidate division WOR-1 bacterium RIFOXYA2_FULL_36_21]OGC14613.1 MAG: hypothetical protein A2282_04165 [candidate division WOR-1 bacterium RIFOXYA12_FULL_36_13]OGC16628.1 MAG: hypothetical protein A2290_03365 [candidate division WOR-1 bacterium RIFOXYB2_FULL_36_35]
MLRRKIIEVYLRLKHGFKIRKPVFLLRLFKNYISILAFKKRPLKYIEFIVDYSCNLKCEHCFAEKLKKPAYTKRMQVEDYKRVASEAMELGAIDFGLQGGEPFLFLDLTEKIIKACRPSMNLIALTTNATLINQSNLKRLRAFGLDNLAISLDSGIAEEHDRFRNAKGTYDKVIDAILLAESLGIGVIVNTTLSHDNIRSEGFLRLIDFASTKKILLNTILAAPSGKWDAKEDLLLTQEDLRYLGKLREKHGFLRRDVDSNYVEWGCGAVKEALYITPYGDVLACPFIHISLGNIFNEPLRVIRERALEINYFSTYHKKCLAGEDREFIEKHMSRTFNQLNLPIGFEKGFK